MFKKYRIKRIYVKHLQAWLYTIQKRYGLFFYKTMKYTTYEGEYTCTYFVGLYREPPEEELAKLLKYG